MRCLLLVVCLLVLGCSSSESGGGGGPESVQSWTCCGFGESSGNCHCTEDTPNTASGCSPSVNACSEVSGGVGCCAATSTEDGWLCECWPPGTDCGSVAPSNSKSVASCPP